MNRKEKISMNLCLLGHSRSGKSTLLDHILLKGGGFDRRTIERHEKMAQETGVQLRYSWILDSLATELKRYSLYDQVAWKFETKYFKFSTSKDVPTHNGYIQQMFSGNSQPDVVLLIVSALLDEFEDCISKDELTRRYLLVTYTLGIKSMIVCVNKMDDPTVNWSEDRFNQIKKKASVYLKRFGHNPQNVLFIPTSGSKNDNLIEKSSNSLWFDGPTVIEALDSITPPKKLIDKPLRIPVQDAYKIGGIGTIVVGRVETGLLKPKMNMTYCSSGKAALVKSIEMNYECLDQAFPGDEIAISLKLVPVKEIKRGYVAGDQSNNPPREASSFVAQVTLLECPEQIFQGYCPLIVCHRARVHCRVKEIKCTIDRKTGAAIEEAPKSVKSGDTCLVTMVPVNSLFVEEYSEYPALGKFVMKDFKRVIAVGVVKSVEKKNDE